MNKRNCKNQKPKLPNLELTNLIGKVEFYYLFVLCDFQFKTHSNPRITCKTHNQSMYINKEWVKQKYKT